MSADRLMKLELVRLNAHLPERPVSLKEALSSPEPRVRARDGSVHRLEGGELELLSRLLPETDWDKLRLPIMIALDPKLGRGAARVSGETEVSVACRLLEKNAEGELLLVYRPEVALLRRKLPTTTQYMFTG